MPKIKTHKGAAKRFRITGSGKIVRQKAFKSHKLAPKDSTRKRRLGQKELISNADKKKVRRLLGK